MIDRRFLVAGVVVVAASVLFVATRSRDPATRGEILTASATLRDFSVVVEVVGVLDAARSTVVTSQLGGRSATIVYLVEEGQHVEEGDELVRFDPSPWQEKVNRLQAGLRKLEAQVVMHEQALEWEQNRADAEVEAAGYDVRTAELDLEQLEMGDGPLEQGKLERSVAEARQARDELAGYVADLEGLEERGYASPTETALAQQKAAEAEGAHEVAQEQLARYRDHVLPTTLEKARGRLQRAGVDLGNKAKAVAFQVAKSAAALDHAREEREAAQAELELAERQLDLTILKAPISGMAVLKTHYYGGQSRKPRVGDVVLQNQPLLYLPDIERMLVNTRVREVDLHKVEIGKSATVRVDAFPDLRLAAEVKSVGVLAEAPMGVAEAVSYFQVVLAVKESDSRLRPGMTARATIHAAEAEAVITVPVQAVFRDRDREVLYIGTSAGFERREVAVGLLSDDWAEIRSGLFEGETVALSIPRSQD